MPYTKHRLAEALRIIRDDTKNRNQVEAAKLLETQYRDGFHLRKSSSNRTSRVLGWPDNHESEDVCILNASKRKRRSTPDDDYGEDCERLRGKKHWKSDQTCTLETGCTSPAIFHTSKRKNSNNKQAESSAATVKTRSTASLVTLKFSTERGRNFLREKLKEYPGMNINMYNIIMNQTFSKDLSSWRSTSGGPQRADKTPLELDKDFFASKNQFNLDETLEEHASDIDLNIAGTLRSGKARATTIPTKRKRRNSDQGQPKGPEVHESQNIDCPKPDDTTQSITDWMKSPDWKANPQTVITSPKGTFDDAISIASSREDDSSDETQSKLQPPLAITNNQRSIRRPAPKPLSPPPSPPPFCSYIPPKHRPARPENINCQGIVEIYTTHFSHPIDFRILNPNDCTFHRDYRYPLFGHGRITTEYIVYPNRPGHLEEIGNGHRAKNKAADGMCVKCALDYMQIVRCPCHTFAPIPPTLKRIQALRENSIVYFKDMFMVHRNDPSRNLKALAEICSLCPAPATTRCCAVQTRNQVGNPCRLPNESLNMARTRLERTSLRRSVSVNTDSHSNINNHILLDEGLSRMSITTASIQPPLYGCGLHLCGPCHMLINDKCHGHMQQNRDLIIREFKGRSLSARADLEFLFREGLLYRAWTGVRGGKAQ